jgi:hypothetical protein
MKISENHEIAAQYGAVADVAVLVFAEEQVDLVVAETVAGIGDEPDPVARFVPVIGRHTGHRFRILVAVVQEKADRHMEAEPGRRPAQIAVHRDAEQLVVVLVREIGRAADEFALVEPLQRPVEIEIDRRERRGKKHRQQNEKRRSHAEQLFHNGAHSSA